MTSSLKRSTTPSTLAAREARATSRSASADSCRLPPSESAATTTRSASSSDSISRVSSPLPAWYESVICAAPMCTSRMYSGCCSPGLTSSTVCAWPGARISVAHTRATSAGARLEA
eukprot:4131798-Prymnesium_polylepis.4